MRLFVLLFFYFIKLEAQQQFRTSDFGYSDDVVKVEESIYKFKRDIREFSLENSSVSEIKDTYIQKQTLRSIFGENISISEYSYSYNPNFTIKEINCQPIDGNIVFPIKFLFQHENGKLKKVIVEHLSSTNYEYDKNGNLSKEIELNADNEPSETIFYQDYIDKKSYTKIKKNNDGSGNDFTREIYKKGLLIESEFVSNDFKTTTKYSYDFYKNVLSQVYNDSSRIDYGYEYDTKNNRIKIAKLSSALPEDNSFTFVKITFADGTTSGCTTLDFDFIKKHDRIYREKDSLFQKYREIAYSRNNYLSILKTDDAKFEIQDSYDNNFEKVIQTADTPEHSSLIIFSETDAAVHFVKNYYSDDFPKNEWIDAIKLDSPTKIFWVKDNKYKISFYQEGKYLESSNFSVENDENPNHLTVNSKDGKVFQIQNIDSSEAGMLYPLKLK